MFVESNGFLLLIQQTRRCTRYYKTGTSKRRTTKSAAAVPVADVGHNKENDSARPTRAKQPSAKARAAAEADDEDDDDAGDNYRADSEEDSGGEDSQVDPQRTRARGGRNVRPSAKAAQQSEEQEEAAARKASKAAKAAQKKHQQETGEEPQPTPLQDTQFQSREVDVHTKKNKTLVPRDSRIPATPVRHPTTSSKESTATVSSQGGSDWRRSSRVDMEVDEEDRRPRGINGNPLPSHVRLDLSAFPQYVADQWATAPRRRHSPSPGLNHTDRGRDYTRPSSPVPRRHRESTPGLHHERTRPSSSVSHHHRGSTPDLDRGHARPSSPPPRPLRHYREPSPSPDQHHEHGRPLSPGRQDPVASTSQRPLSPASGSKRARSPAEDLRRTQAQKVNDHQGRARAKDYDSTTQEIVATAIMYFRCLLATEDAFPDHTSESHLLTLAWAMARDEHKIAMDLAPDIAKLITSRTSQMHGELKTKVRGLVELTFGFESGQNKKNIRKNRQLAEDLKEDMGYAHQVNPSKAEGRKGLYKANIIQKATNLMWFGNRRAEGAMHPEIFGPALPKPTLALVLTAVECGIDEWATGIKTDVPFTSADYRSIYTDHINSMTAFEKRSAPRDILGNILTRLHNVGRFHSGSQPLVAARTTSLSTSAIDAAIREYDEDSETVTEGEFGDDDE